MPRLSISSWSLHQLLGRAWYEPDGDGEFANRRDETPQITLLDVPREAAAHGIGTVELCHFHLASTETPYLEALSSAISTAGVELFSILIDTGDIAGSDETHRIADLQTIAGWIDVAAALGAGHVRVIAGDAPVSDEAIRRSVEGLVSLAQYAKSKNVQVLTENFKQLAARPETCLQILQQCGGSVGLCADFGNFPATSRTQDLAAVLPKANSIHAKADYVDGVIEQEAYINNVRLAVEAGFDGPMSLIYQDADDVWQRLDEMKTVMEQVLR